MEEKYRPTQAPDDPRVTDATLLRHAWEFAAAADAYAKADNLRSWMPLYFLFGRSMELAMKAFAIHAGATVHDLRDRRTMWHDLELCMKYVEARGFTLSPPLDEDERNGLLLVNEYYSEKDLEYPLEQGYAVPQPFIMRGIVDRMIAAAFIAIWGVDRYQVGVKRRRELGLTIDPEIDFGAPVRGYAA